MRKIVFVASLGLVMFCGSVSATTVSGKDSKKTLIESVYTKTVEKLYSAGLISEKEATMARKDGIIITSAVEEFDKGGDAKSAVDKAATLSVERGYYKDVKSAKAGFKRIAEKARKDSSLWSKFYSMLGL